MCSDDVWPSSLFKKRNRQNRPGGRVNCITPGLTRMPMVEVEKSRLPKYIHSLRCEHIFLNSNFLFILSVLFTRTSLKKVATPLDIANQISVLTSPLLSGHVTGQVIMVTNRMEGAVLSTREDLGI